MAAINKSCDHTQIPSGLGSERLGSDVFAGGSVYGASSSNGVACSAWGTPAWFTQHCVARNYPVRPAPDDACRQRYRTYFKSFGHVLPCSSCRGNYAAHLSQVMVPEVFDSRAAMCKFVFDLQNKVTAHRGKTPLSEAMYAQVDAFYESLRAGNGSGRSFVFVAQRPEADAHKHSIVFDEEYGRTLLENMQFIKDSTTTTTTTSSSSSI